MIKNRPFLAREVRVRESRQMKELSGDKAFEKMLKAAIRSLKEEERRKAAREHERLSDFLSEISRGPGYRRLRIIEKKREGFPMNIFGEVFYPGDGVTAIVGDLEIPDESVVDRALVVKGKLKIGSKCRVLKKLRALRALSIASGGRVKGDLECGGTIELGENTTIEGNVKAESSLKLSQGVTILGFVDARGAYVSSSALDEANG